MIRALLTLIVFALFTFVFVLSYIYSYIFIVFQAVKRGSYTYFKKTYNHYVYKVLWGLDQAANPVVRHSFTHWFVKPGGISFGPVDKTLSHIFGVNKYFERLKEENAGKQLIQDNKLYAFGRFIGHGIDVVFGWVGDKDANGKNNHLKKAAKSEQYNQN